MAKKKLNLQAYQQDILERIRSQSKSSRASSSSRLGVSIGESNWLVALADISEVLPFPEIMQVPQTHSWFIGMANVRGNLYALTDLAVFFGNPATTPTAESRVLLVHGKFGINAGLLVNRLIGLRSVEDMTLQKDATKNAASQTIQYKDTEGQVWHELSLESLLNQNEFMQVAA
jgi:twitching motility protein PilI